MSAAGRDSPPSVDNSSDPDRADSPASASGDSSAPRWVLTVDAADAGTRLDKFLAARVEGASRSQVQRHLEGGFIQLDGAPPRRGAKTTVQVGDTIAYTPPPPEPTELIAEDIPLSVLFEDQDIIVVDKPSRMVVHPSLGHATGTLVNALLHHIQDLGPIGDSLRPGLVHRLDQDTTGAIVVAKNQLAFDGLKTQFSERKVIKQYVCVVHGVLTPRAGTFDTLHGRHPRDRKRFSSRVKTGKHAITHYETEAIYPGASLVAVRIDTGRTHQIRVHMADNGCPIVADPLYPRRGPRITRDPRVRPIVAAFERCALHAHFLSFRHPRSHQRVELEAPIPDDMSGLIEALEEAAASPA